MIWAILLTALGIVAILEYVPSVLDGTTLFGGGGTSDMSSAPDNQSGSAITITNDPSTWPARDRIWDICRAIARAEGADRAGTNPDRLNNPGDLSDDADRYGFEDHSGSRVTVFPDKMTGWAALYDKIARIVNGGSSVYPASWTWTQVAQTWAGNWKPWLRTVTAELGVDANSTPADYVNGVNG